MSALFRGGSVRIGVVVCLAASAAAVPALGNVAGSSGGAGYVTPTVTALKCKKPDGRACLRGAQLRVKGQGLAATSSVVFLGRRGKRDDVAARPLETTADAAVVRIPGAARTGRVRAIVGGERADGPRLRVGGSAYETSTTDGSEGIFPIRARHQYGTETNRFGGGRGHEGQDVFAKCGKRLVSALDGRVTHATYHSRAGNYVVIQAKDGTSQAYMHLLSPAIVDVGDRVVAGQDIGQVGETGRATGCHLHFEFWTAPGYYEGGEPIDPLPKLKAWDRVS